MANSESYANDYETSLNGAITTTVRPVNFVLADPIPSTLSGGAFRVRIDNEWLFVPAGGVSGQNCNGATTVEGSVAATHSNGAKVDQVLTRQGLLNNPGPMTTQGDLYTLDATLNPVRVPLGTDGQVLTSDANTSGLPKWKAASGGGGGGGGGASVSTKVGGMYRNAALALTTGSFQKMPFDTVLPNMDNSNIVIGSSRYVADVAGVYHFDAAVRWDATESSTGLAFRINGGSDATSLITYDGLLGSAGDEISMTIYLNAGDYIELNYYVGGAANVDQTNYPKVATRMVGYRVDLMGVSVASTMVARMYRNAAYTLTAGAYTKFPYDTVDYDPQSAIQIASNQFTAPVTGKYMLVAHLYSTTADRIALRVKVNGNIVRGPQDWSGTYAALLVTQVDLSANDVVIIEYFAGGADVVTLGVPTKAANFFEIALIAASGAGIIVPQGPVTIPGFAGSADIQPASPSASNDEFETTGASTPTGWTAMTQAPDAVNANAGGTPGAKSHLYLKALTASDTLKGIYKAAPAVPFTVTAKLADHTLQGGSSHCGLVLADASPPVKAIALQLVAFQAPNTSTQPANIAATVATYTTINAAPSTGGAGIATRQVGWLGGPLYLRIVVHALNNIDFQVSYDGLLWIPLLTGYANGVGLANAGQIGIYADYNGGAVGSAEAMFDWIRFS